MSAPRAGVKTRGDWPRKGLILSPRDDALLWELEERFWTSGLASARTTTANGAVMVFPYPAGILQGDRIRRRPTQGTGWRTVEMRDRSAAAHGVLAVLAYLVSAEKADAPTYEALCASTYYGWLRISHEQTPIT